MVVQQIYNILNDVAKQTMGQEAITVVDTNTFIALGQKVMNSQDLTENFTNTLVLRIARTIISYRRYRSRLRPLVFDDIRWGAIVQKVKAKMPKAVPDAAYDLVDGQSVDMYIVNKPELEQKFFVNSTPYSFFVTIQSWQMRRAFLSEAVMSSLMSAIYGEIQNKLEQSFENLGYMTLCNFMGNIAGTTQQIHLVTEYNSDTGETLAPGMSALNSSDFMRWTVSKLNLMSVRLADITTIYNKEGEERHTPQDLQRLIVLADFQERLKTVVEWTAFNAEFVRTNSSIIVPRWQAHNNPASIMVTDAENNQVSLQNVIAFIHDRDALGTYRKEQEVLTTPVNARGRYTNTFYHEEQMWFNDLSENGIFFTLD